MKYFFNRLAARWLRVQRLLREPSRIGITLLFAMVGVAAYLVTPPRGEETEWIGPGGRSVFKVHPEDFGKSAGGSVVFIQPWSPDAADIFRARVGGLSDADFYGNRHAFGRPSSDSLQRHIDRRLSGGEAAIGSYPKMRALFHMMILRECILEELARRDYEDNWFGHTFDGPSSILGKGFSGKHDDDLRKVRRQRGELATVFLQNALVAAR